jgi:uncharacterized membrane protein SpoIIM required for sporulation
MFSWPARPDRHGKMTEYRDTYAELSALMERIESRGYGSLGDDDVLRLGSLYRTLMNDLARARRDRPGSSRERDLNQLAAKVHNVILSGGRIRSGRVSAFFSRDLPLCVRRHVGALLVAVLFFLAGGVFAWLFVDLNPDRAHTILDPMIIENAERGFSDEMFDEAAGAWHARPMFVTFYVTNNTKVAFTAFALGIFFALPTVLILFLNGITMGGTIAIVQHKGLLPNLLAFVSPHGGIELLAIFLSSAAGMLIGLALLSPGRLTRAEALKRRAYDVMTLVIAAALMLVIAAFIVSPMPFDNRIKYGLGCLNLALVLAYLLSGFFMKSKSLAETDEINYY